MPTVDSTPRPKVLSLLLQTSQKIPDMVKFQSEKVISLFLRFLGYNTDDVLLHENGTSEGIRYYLYLSTHAASYSLCALRLFLNVISEALGCTCNSFRKLKKVVFLTIYFQARTI